MGQYLGSTEEKMSAKIKKAKHRVLFVSEAYCLTPRSISVHYRQIVINQLMAIMEKGDTVMIFAGYPAQIKEFLSANPGLSSKIKYKFTSPNYFVQEMATILENEIRESGYGYEGETSLADILKKETTKQVWNQQNGRLAKNILGEAIINLSSRLLFEDDGARLMTLGEEDIIHGCQAFCEPVEPCQDTTGSEVTEPK